MMHWNTIKMCPLLHSARYYRRDIQPRHTVKVFSPNPDKKPPIKLKIKKPLPRTETVLGPRINDMGIQMLSHDLHKQLFKTVYGKATSATIDRCKQTLARHGMGVQPPSVDLLPDIALKLPPLEGDDLIQHFHNIGRQQAQPYQAIVEALLGHIPAPPTTWLLQSGWTKYVAGREPMAVAYPPDDGLIFDVEVCVAAGKAPTIATAVSTTAWYCWVSPAVLQGTAKPVTTHQYSLDCLIPMQTEAKQNYSKNNAELSRARVVIGHNVSYDRARIKEQYWMQRTALRFVDTMSLHICVSGLTSYQRAVLKSGEVVEGDEEWMGCSSLNSLTEVHRLYCGSEVAKETRDLFVNGTLKDIQEHFQAVTTYCAGDVTATHAILKHLFPLFLERFPHPVTFAGMLELGMAYLPVNSNWNRYIDEAEQTYEDMQTESRFILARKADHTCHLLHDDQYKGDLWMWDQDWTVRNIKLRKVPRLVTDEVEQPSNDDEEVDPLEEKFAHLKATRHLLPKVRTLLPGYPEWYRKLCTKPDSDPHWLPGPHAISTAMQITPKLLGLTWEGFPLHYVRAHGWGFLVPTAATGDTCIPLAQLIARCPLVSDKPTQLQTVENRRMDREVADELAKREYYSRVQEPRGDYRGTGVWCDTVLDECVTFYKLPHKDGRGHRVGNPLAKDFLAKFSESVLAGDTASAEHVLSIARMLSYWRNNRARILDQMIAWLTEAALPYALRTTNARYGAIVPQVVVCGTLTRRAVEPTWMTASNAHAERIGSELRGMVQAPPGYSLVGADVDSQELWIAAVIGDAHLARMHGASPFGWQTLSGSKASGTDMHSMTAKAVGISREHAKVLNYARIYGAGERFAEQLLRQFNPTMAEIDARRKASKMFALTKGKRVYRLRRPYLANGLDDVPYNRWQAKRVCKLHDTPLQEMFDQPQWIDGTESAMFNRLEAIANDPQPVTPFLGGRLSRALEPGAMPGDRFLPTRVNWVVQSGAVDFLHLMLVCMRWLMRDRLRFCLSFHDEVRYLVADEHKYQAALAMHVTNLLVRSYCALQLGLNDLPRSVAFFASVEVDTVLRKEARHECRTPSNPHGLQMGYGVAQGESLTIGEAAQRAGGDCSWWHDTKR